MKIDIFPHIMPPEYVTALEDKVPPNVFLPYHNVHKIFPALTDLKQRFVMMDKCPDVVQVLTLSIPFIERVMDQKTAVELAKLGNDCLAELVDKYPDRFIGAIGSLPMNDLDAAMDELDRTVNELKFKGIQICTDINGKPLDAPEFMPLYDKMVSYDLPILLHPTRSRENPDYDTEDISLYRLHHMFGWPYDTSAAMIRLVMSKVLQNYPKIKFITHHCGAMIPFFDKRITTFLSDPAGIHETGDLDKSPIAYLKMFYADTALSGGVAGLMCGYSFFGADHILFGTDMPYGSRGDFMVLEEVIKAIEQMNIPDDEKEKIFSGNAISLFHLKV
jgi:aminocarboxymuconate-semialdehyde decarboxylase